MKHLILFALFSVLLAGCADSPLKEASIEDRATTTATNNPDTSKSAMKNSTDSEAAQKPVESMAVNTGKTPSSSGVETRGLALQTPESKALSDKNIAAESGAGMQTDRTDTLKYVAQPVLDPKDPQSPLAQRRLLFDYDSAAIRDEYRTLLEMHAQYLKNERTAKVILQGHTDERGSREYNLALGQRRSESVYKALSLLGVPDNQMEAVSIGEEKPVVEGHDEESWAQNRRAELLYQGE